MKHIGWDFIHTSRVLLTHFSGVEYLVAGHTDRKQGRLLVNMKSFVKPWKASLGRKVVTLLRKDCNW